MSEPQPDFYLASTETAPPIEPRKCFVLERLRGEWGEDLLRVKLDPPLIGAPSLKDASYKLEEVMLQARFGGETILAVTRWPLDVYIGRIVHDKIKGTGTAAWEDVHLEHWGEIYRSLEEADKDIAPFR